MARCLGLDIGDKRIGVALSDAEGILASPLTIISYENEQTAIDAIMDIAGGREIGCIVIGLPRTMGGDVGQQAEKVKGFVQKLGERVKIPLEFRDERLTSVIAQRLIKAAETKKSKRKIHDDAIAAAVILQSYLDEKRRPGNNVDSETDS